MMTMVMNLRSPDELDIQELEKEYAVLTVQSESLSEQIEGESNADNKVTLIKRREKVKQEMRQTWTKLESLRRRSTKPANQYLTFKDDLPNIDFNEILDEIRNLIQSFRQERGDLLLLVQKKLPLSGDLCLQRIYAEFQRGTGDFRKYPLGFYSGDNLDEHGWLHKLAGYFGLEPQPDAEQLAALVIDKLCQSVRNGSTIILEIFQWDDLPSQKDTLEWFITYFWAPLTNKLNDKSKYRQVKFIAAIVVDGELSSDCFRSTCLCENDTPFRWLKLPLRNWTQEEIQIWLECYPGIAYPRSLNMAKTFYTASFEGVPSIVRQALEAELILKAS